MTESPMPSPVMPPPPLEDWEGAPYLAETSTLFRGEGKSPNRAGLFLGTLVAFFAIWWALHDGLANSIILIAVLLIHELGHLSAMRAFGYRDVKIFFIPFFGAAASGKKRDGSAGKEAAVLLLGPMPGLVAGLVCSLVALDNHDALLIRVALFFVGLNAFNLVPVMPLDGGNLFSLILYSRWRWLEVLCTGLSAVALVAFGFAYELWVLGGLGVMMLISLQVRARMLGVGAALRIADPTLSPDPTVLDEPQVRDLFVRVRAALPPRERDKPKVVAAFMEQVLAIATRRTPSGGASFAIFAIWLGGWALAAATLVFTRIGR